MRPHRCRLPNDRLLNFSNIIVLAEEFVNLCGFDHFVKGNDKFFSSAKINAKNLVLILIDRKKSNADNHPRKEQGWIAVFQKVEFSD